MDYEEMSDFAINQAVTCEVFGCHGWEINSCGDFYHCGADGSGYFVQTVSDYCNNPSYAWPIIMSNKIGVWVRTGSTGEWIARLNMEKLSNGLLVVEYAMHQDSNPLRAAMIVFLMMKDAECQKS